jgi:Tol biopolymer transport system component
MRPSRLEAVRIILVILVAVALLCCAPRATAAESGYDLFQKALAKERAEGNLAEAIQLYQRIVREFAQNHSLAAKALVQMGLCYEKQGKGEARKAYQRVLSEYADQRDLVREARARLALLDQLVRRFDPTAVVARQVWSGRYAPLQGAVFPDGQHLTFIDWETRDLAVRDLATGLNRRLTNNGSDSPEWGFGPVTSPDGRYIVYAWMTKDTVWQLRVLELNARMEPAAAPRTLCRDKELEVVWPADWSPDGKRILAGLSKKLANRIVEVSVADGSVTVLKNLGAPDPGKMRYSPDGRYILYDYPQQEGSWERDVFLISVDGKREISLVRHPAHDFALGWSPDGSRVLFASDRLGPVGAWAVPVSDGKAVGPPELVRKDIGLMLPWGFTRRGSFYYALQTGIEDVYIATLDPATGKLTSTPEPVNPRLMGSNQLGSWSEDGKYLAYVRKTPGSPRPDFTLYIRTMETGSIRVFPVKLRGNRALWSPDGRFLLVRPQVTLGPSGAHALDVQTGELKLAIPDVPLTEIGLASWTADSKAILYGRWGPDGSRILLRDIETGQEKEVLRHDGGVILSPDGKQLVLNSYDEAAKTSTLSLMPFPGGPRRELLKVQQPENLVLPSWTPDSRFVVVRKNRRAANGAWQSEFWRVPVEGGSPLKLELNVEGLFNVRFHPDGRRIAVQAGEFKSEVWVMDNLLPVTRASR